MNHPCRQGFRHSRCLVFGLLTAAVVVLATNSAAQQGGQKWEVLNNKATGNFMVALAQDLQANIWVGTEDKGVFRYDPKAPRRQPVDAVQQQEWTGRRQRLRHRR